MKKFTKIVALAIVMTSVLIGTYAFAVQAPAKTNICHGTSSQQNPWNAIQINTSALPTHLGHNDFLYSGPLKQNGMPADNGNAWCNNNAPAQISAAKVICSSEADLPNWGNNGPNITAATVPDFLATHPNCHEQSGWKYQWAPGNATNPGNNVEVAGGAWTTFDENNLPEITPGQKVWVREQIPAGYIPFSGATSNLGSVAAKNSAEFYCGTDVLNYDNYDSINNPQAGMLYHCVAFNVQIDMCPNIEGKQATVPQGYNLDGQKNCVPDTATVHATKVVCDTEWDLPNWGNNGPNMTATTATDYVAGNDSCRIVPWTFEWAPESAANPGDNIEVAGGAWTPFSNGTAVVPAGSLIWLREQLPTAYHTFSGASTDLDGTNAKRSAEFYCGTDVLNYDNYDKITPVVGGTDYYCVGFNTLKPTKADGKVHVFKFIDGVQATADMTKTEAKPDGVSFPVYKPEAPNYPFYLGPYSDAQAGDIPYESSTGTKVGGETFAVVEDLTTPLVGSSCSNENNPDYELVGYTIGKTLDEAKNGVKSLTTPQVTIDGDAYIIVWNHKCVDEAPATGSIEITKYACPANFVPNRTDNGVGSTVPDGCVAQSGAAFGYVHGDQTDANGPYPELNAALTPGGSTDVDGKLVIGPVASAGRYLIKESDPTNLLGLYCQGDGDTNPNNNDNQELTFVPVNGVTKCVAYNKAQVTDNCPVGKVSNGDDGCVCPVGQQDVDGQCVTDVCVNVDGIQSEMPQGYHSIGDYMCEKDEVTQCEAKTLDIYSDGSTTWSEDSPAIATWVHPGWTASIPGATWIWNAFNIADPINETNETFTRTFNIEGTPTAATLEVSADNSYSVDVNATTDAFSDNSIDNFLSADSHDPLSLLTTGANTLTFKVKNLAYTPTEEDVPDYEENPAGLLYKLHIESEICPDNGGGNQPPVADAGPDQTITLPTNSGILDGAGSSDPDLGDTIASYVWTQVSGPTTIDPSDSNPSGVGSLVVGTYEFKLVVTDNHGAVSAADTMTVTVNPAVVDGGDPKPACSDGSDNDDDGLVDNVDPGCHNDGNPNNPDSYNPSDDNESNEGSNPGPTGSGRTGSRSTSGSIAKPQGQVLGEQTTCGIYIDKFLRRGYNNNTEAVKKLQQFLNDYMKAGLVVDGNFGLKTEVWLKKFQAAYPGNVLKPWGFKAPTGIFYLTTQTQVNNIMCPDLKLPIPKLTPIETNPLAPKKL